MDASNTVVIPRTALSAGTVISDTLNAVQAIKSRVTRIFPNIAEAEAKLPYICYKREGLVRTQTKTQTGKRADAASYAVEVFAKSYGESVDIAELVAEALDGKSASNQQLRVRRMMLADASEGWADNAYYQSLVFEVRVD